jgi:quercetin dioxygenase-like cupin family protein
MSSINYRKVTSGVDVSTLVREVENQPELWNKNPCRLSSKGPHRETQDMFLRYRDESPFIKRDDWRGFADEHFAIWNKTIDFLPSAKRITFDLMAGLNGENLGGVFLYQILPGKQIYQHTDQGWHPEFYDKFNVCLKSNPKAAFYYEGDAMVQEAGDVHWFRNDVKHWVKNDGDTPHLVLTVCMKLDTGERAPWSPDWWVKEIRKCQ